MILWLLLTILLLILIYLFSDAYKFLFSIISVKMLLVNIYNVLRYFTENIDIIVIINRISNDKQANR